MGVCAFGGLVKASLLQLARIVRIALLSYKILINLIISPTLKIAAITLAVEVLKLRLIFNLNIEEKFEFE